MSTRLMLPIITVIAAFEREAWRPKELHLSTEDWWELREEIASTTETPIAFFGLRLTMVFRDVYIVANPLFEQGNYRFEPIAPTSVGARMMAALEEFRGGIKKA